MEERFANRSVPVVLVVILTVLCESTEQRPVDWGENALPDPNKDHPRSLNSKYLSPVDDPTAMKLLMETLLMQHNEYAEANSSAIDDEENSTERPPSGTSFMDVIHQLKPIGAKSTTSRYRADENSTERPPTEKEENVVANSTKVNEENSTERPPIEGGTFADVLNQLKPLDETTTKDMDSDESHWEVTTLQPQQLASPFDINEFHSETTTAMPEQGIDSGGKLNVTTQTLVNSMKQDGTPFQIVNIPPTKSKHKKPTGTTTKSPHVILRPPQLHSYTETVSKTRQKTTTMPDKKVNSLKPVDRDQDVRHEIELAALNRPISTRKPLASTASPGGGASSNRPNKKPINIILESVVKKGQEQKPGATRPQGSGIRNPNPNLNPNPVAAPSTEPDDYLISALASIADGEENYADEEEEDEDDEEEDEEDEDEDEDEDEVSTNEDEEEEEDDYLNGSAEETEERKNFDYIDSVDASDVISSVMAEVGALI